MTDTFLLRAFRTIPLSHVVLYVDGLAMSFTNVSYVAYKHPLAREVWSGRLWLRQNRGNVVERDACHNKVPK